MLATLPSGREALVDELCFSRARRPEIDAVQRFGTACHWDSREPWDSLPSPSYDVWAGLLEECELPIEHPRRHETKTRELNGSLQSPPSDHEIQQSHNCGQTSSYCADNGRLDEFDAHAAEKLLDGRG